ncbi:MAG: hypothetical protein IPG45_13815 [Deltaproteobacteria bacterium]|nr:hypothetical protein [Deltaproteobacteria bacterium]
MAAAFEAMRAEFIQQRRAVRAVVPGGQRFGLFPSWEEALASGLMAFGTTETFLILQGDQEAVLEARGYEASIEAQQIAPSFKRPAPGLRRLAP